MLDGRKFEWGLPFITGLHLKRLAGVDPNSYGVWLSQRVGDDKLIGNKEKVDLQGDGTERFFTGIDTTTEGAGAVVLPPEDRHYLREQGIEYEEVGEGATKAVVLKGWSLPPARFDAGAADILMLPQPIAPDLLPKLIIFLALASVVAVIWGVIGRLTQIGARSQLTNDISADRLLGLAILSCTVAGLFEA